MSSPTTTTTSVVVSTHGRPLPTATGERTWRAVLNLARPHRLLTASALTVLVIGTAVGLLVPLILGHLVDVVLAGTQAVSERQALMAPIVALFCVAATCAVLTGVAAVLVSRLGETMLADLREGVVLRALAMPQEQVEAAGSGDLVSRVSGDVSAVASAVRSAVPDLVAAILVIGFTLLGMLALDWRFAGAGLLAAPIQVWALLWYLRSSAPVFTAERAAVATRTQRVLDAVRGAQTIRTHRLGPAQLAGVQEASLGAVQLGLSANRLVTRLYGRLNLAEAVGLIATLAVGFMLVRAGEVSVGAAAAAALFFHRLFDPVNTFLGLFGTMQEAGASLARLVGIAALAPDAPALSDVDLTGRTAVRVSGVSFGYAAGQTVLDDVTLDLRPGEHVALVGPSGAGKSTLASLVAGIHRPTSGEVTFAGVPIGELRPERLRRAVAVVTQEVHVFHGTVAENLLLADPTASRESLVEALETVLASSWVSALPGGMDAVVGEGGHQLTSEQAQQMALARLVLVDPAVAVLDEATADAGSAGARRLDSAAQRAIAGRSALIVAHRLSQAATADRILVLEGGRIAEEGTHDELVASGGTYTGLWDAWSAGRGIAPPT